MILQQIECRNNHEPTKSLLLSQTVKILSKEKAEIMLTKFILSWKLLFFLKNVYFTLACHEFILVNVIFFNELMNKSFEQAVSNPTWE